MIMLGACVTSLVLSHCSKNMKQQTDQCYSSVWFPRFCLAAGKIWSDRWASVTALCYSSVLFGKQRKIQPQGMAASRPKRHKEKRSSHSIFGFSFYVFFSLPPEPALCKLGYPGGLFTWGPYSSLQAFLCSIFTGFSLLFLLSTTMLSSLEKHLFRFSAHF